VQLPIADAGDLAVVGFEDDRGLLGVAVREIAIEAVVRNVELAVVEPLVERCVAFVERSRERFVPRERLTGEVRPESLEVPLCLRVQRLAIGLLDVRLRDTARTPGFRA
jgi:hypothetical protein